MDSAKNIFGEKFLIFGIFKRIFGIKYEFLAYFLPQKRIFKNYYVLAKSFQRDWGKLFYPPNFPFPFPKTEKEKDQKKEKIEKFKRKKKTNFLRIFPVDPLHLLPKKEEKREEITKFSFSISYSLRRKKREKKREKGEKTEEKKQK